MISSSSLKMFQCVLQLLLGLMVLQPLPLQDLSDNSQHCELPICGTPPPSAFAAVLVTNANRSIPARTRVYSDAHKRSRHGGLHQLLPSAGWNPLSVRWRSAAGSHSPSEPSPGAPSWSHPPSSWAQSSPASAVRSHPPASWSQPLTT